MSYTRCYRAACCIGWDMPRGDGAAGSNMSDDAVLSAVRRRPKPGAVTGWKGQSMGLRSGPTAIHLRGQAERDPTKVDS